MKTIQLISILLLSSLLLISGRISAQDKKNNKEQEVTFSVEIDCVNCQQKLEAKLPHEKGVRDLKIDLDKQTIWFKYRNDKTNKEELIKALDKLGYEAKEIVEKEEKGELQLATEKK